MGFKGRKYSLMIVFFLLIGFALASGCASERPAQSEGYNGLIGWWELDHADGNTAHDSSGNNNHGRLVGLTDSLWSNPQGAYRFDGDQYVSIDHLGSYNTVTISTWINVRGLQRDLTSIFHNDGWGRDDLHLHINSDGILRLGVNGNNPTDATADFRFTPDTFHQWHHIAVVYDRPQSKVDFYINGYLDSTTFLSNARPAKIGPMRIGSWNQRGRAFRGLIKDFRIYDQPLAHAEIADLAGIGLDDIFIHETRSMLTKPNYDSLRAAITYLEEEYGSDYPNGTHFLERIAIKEQQTNELLTELEKLIDTVTIANIESHIALRDELANALDEVDLNKLAYEALVESNPLFDFNEIVFVKRSTFQSDHWYTNFINGIVMGGNIYTLDLETGNTKELFPELDGGVFDRFDLSFDADKIVFDYKSKFGEGFRIYEANIDGTGLTQLTVPPDDEAARIARFNINYQYNHHTDDFHPAYLPDGGIVFVSTRPQHSILCDAPDLFTATLIHRMDGDGSNIEKLSNSVVSEVNPTVMNDGRILYTRWEYVDKGHRGPKCLWAMNPDGTNSQEVFGNNVSTPPSFVHGRPIPGTNDMFVMTGTPHFPQNDIGTIIKVDINYPIRTREPMTYITPTVDIQAEGGYVNLVDDKWIYTQSGPLYRDPYPLSDKFFLVSHNPDKAWNDPTAYGLYLIDEFGNHVEIYSDPQFSCWVPTPLKTRDVPPVIATSASPALAEEDMGLIFMADVYHGLEGVERGSIKHLRVWEQVPRPWAARRLWDGDSLGLQHAAVTKDTHLFVRVLHGIVPVEEDGSAQFLVPADRNLFFQAIDEDYMEVQRMRTFINVRPGEMRSCLGCHQDRELSPPVLTDFPMALEFQPELPKPQPGEDGPRVIHYPTDVQPIFDNHCISCHSGRQPAARLDLSDTITPLFTRSYEQIIDRRLVAYIDEVDPRYEGLHNVTPVDPFTLGSHSSRLIQVLLEGHHDVDLSHEEWIRLVTWVDSNAQYYGSYYGRRNSRYLNHRNFRPVPTFESAISPEPPLPDRLR